MKYKTQSVLISHISKVIFPSICGVILPVTSAQWICLSFPSIPPTLPVLFFLRERRGGQRGGGGEREKSPTGLPASGWVDGTFLMSSYRKLSMCPLTVQGYGVTLREQFIPQIPLTTHDQVMQAAEHNTH